MARVKTAIITRKKHKKVLKRAKGYYGAKHYRFRMAKQAVMKSGNYAYVGRKDKKSNFRKLWIARINAAARMNGTTYSKLVAGLKKANVKNIIVSCPSSTKLNVNGTISSSQSHDLIAQDKNKLVVTLSPESLQNISKTLGEETRSFLDLFMAPVITGEKMTDEEYLDLLESVYGKEITNDIKKASIKFTMTVPDGCRQKSYKAPEGISVSATDKSVSFSYPLLRLLTLTGTETSFIQW